MTHGHPPTLVQARTELRKNTVPSTTTSLESWTYMTPPDLAQPSLTDPRLNTTREFSFANNVPARCTGRKMQRCSGEATGSYREGSQWHPHCGPRTADVVSPVASERAIVEGEVRVL